MLNTASNDDLRGTIAPYGEGVNAFVKSREVSIKYLHKNWAKFNNLNSANKFMEYAMKLQRGEYLGAKNCMTPPEEWVRGQKELKNLLDEITDVKIGKKLKLKLSRKERAYLFYEDDEESEKIYLFAIDASHKIAD